jgi:hypothetical protein
MKNLIAPCAYSIKKQIHVRQVMPVSVHRPELIHWIADDGF